MSGKKKEFVYTKFGPDEVPRLRKFEIRFEDK